MPPGQHSLFSTFQPPPPIAAPWHYVRGLPRPVWTLAFVSLINRMGVMAMPFLVLYLTQARGFTEAAAALTLGIHGAGLMAGAALGGWLCDRLGALRVLKTALVGGGVLMVLFPLAHARLAIQVLAFVWPLVADMGRPSALAVLTALVAPAQRRQAIALNRLAVNLGMSVGPFAGGFLAMWSFPSIFVVDGLSSLAAGAVLVWTLRAVPAETTTRPAPQLDRRAWQNGELVRFLGLLFVLSVVFMQQFGPLSLYVVERLYHPKWVFGALVAVNTLLIVVFEVPVNGWTHGWSARRGLATGGALIALGVALMAFVVSPLLLAVGIAIAAFGEMLLFPMSAAHVADLAPPGQMGRYMGAYTFAFGMAHAVGPALGTFALARWGAFATFAGAGVVGAGAAALLLRAIGPPPRP